MTTRKRLLLIGLAVTVVAGPLLLVPVTAYREFAYICKNTGSRKGHTEWLLGHRTHHWNQQSLLETFMRTNAPDVLRNDWVSYMGTGRNIFGGKTLHGHGRPGAILNLRFQDLNAWIQQASDSERRQIYDLLASTNQPAIKKAIEDIHAKLFSDRVTMTE